ncbi:FCD domain-containing protein, partial [Protofrankia coriariae]|uniref:FCD domain-containing protein n=1 Tax=Protofrankia coriariae TaxID=1562887 RepID=UPI001F204E08
PAGGPAREARAPAVSRSAVADFHGLLVELAGNQTLIVLVGMLRHIIDMAREETSGTGSNAGTSTSTTARPGTPVAGDDGRQPYRQLVALIEAGAADEAEALWRRHLLATTPTPERAPATVAGPRAEIPEPAEDHRRPGHASAASREAEIPGAPLFDEAAPPDR